MTSLIQFKVDEKICFEALLEENTLKINEDIILSSFYEDNVVLILSGKYSISYVENGEDKIDYFNFGSPLENMREYVKVFSDLPINPTISQNIDNFSHDNIKEIIIK